MMTSLFDAKEIYYSNGRKFSIADEKFFLIGKLWFCLMHGSNLKEKTYNHIAFKVTKKSLPIYLEKIYKLDLEIKEGRPRIKEECDSIYFYDYDNHLFELHTGTLKKRLKKYLDW